MEAEGWDVKVNTLGPPLGDLGCAHFLKEKKYVQKKFYIRTL